MNWCEIPEEKRTDEQKEACRRAYFNTLLKDPEGREMYADMLRRSIEFVHLSLSHTEYAVAVHVLGRFLRETRSLCGPISLLKSIEAQFVIAAMPEPEKPKPGAPDGFEAKEFNSQ